jgi:hypothetical protein
MAAFELSTWSWYSAALKEEPIVEVNHFQMYLIHCFRMAVKRHNALLASGVETVSTQMRLVFDESEASANETNALFAQVTRDYVSRFVGQSEGYEMIQAIATHIKLEVQASRPPPFNAQEYCRLSPSCIHSGRVPYLHPVRCYGNDASNKSITKTRCYMVDKPWIPLLEAISMLSNIGSVLEQQAMETLPKGFISEITEASVRAWIELPQHQATYTKMHDIIYYIVLFLESY